MAEERRRRIRINNSGLPIDAILDETPIDTPPAPSYAAEEVVAPEGLGTLTAFVAAPGEVTRREVEETRDRLRVLHEEAVKVVTDSYSG